MYGQGGLSCGDLGRSRGEEKGRDGAGDPSHNRLGAGGAAILACVSVCTRVVRDNN
ncbi:hypothetical protein ppKF707_3670 [Metapseudomonas furukawaii]|uniref:Uncharacterized protein n=1 Tax=Metapseudomonas furukawaii TaxID=1149133 RepID=A0AAD1BYJ7_METFU|nr:hypothetical protein ppKF707_3670 [Pseudomonas furukawaii]BAU73455.1 hypothetical protein KF707C_17670 [Pseudomonas furukawaii]